MPRHYAPSGLDLGAADKIDAILQERLASLIDLSLVLKHVHWNVVGRGFIAVHEMMDTQTDLIREMVDAVAERISTLGGIPGGLASQVVVDRSVDQEYALGRAPVMGHLGALDLVYQRLCAGQREAIDQLSTLDLVTQEMLISQTARLEMNHWFIRAHLSDTEGRLITERAPDQLDAATEATHALQPEAVTNEVAEET